MKVNMPQNYFSKIMRAIVEFDMIAEGDRILIGTSGGKDSVFLVYALACFRERLKKNFSLQAFTLDPLFSENFPLERLAAFCGELDIPFASHKVDIAGIIRAKGGKNPCFHCSYFRRGAIDRYAKEHGFNKIAYAHNHDDAVETFLMSLFYSGQLTTFTPVTHLDRSGLTVIRPLIYLRERELKKAQKYHGFTPLDSPCPFDGKTKRQEIKELIARLSEESRFFYPHIAAGMRESALGELWPRAKTRDEMRKAYYAYFQDM